MNLSIVIPLYNEEKSLIELNSSILNVVNGMNINYEIVYVDDGSNDSSWKQIKELSTKYKTIKNSQLKEFLITILHEIYHAMDAKKYGWKKFKDMYEMEMNLQIAKGKDEYDDNKYEIEAEKFGQKNWSKWKTRFKKEGLI